MIIRAVLDTAVDRLFDYAVPPELEPAIQPGVLSRQGQELIGRAGYVPLGK